MKPNFFFIGAPKCGTTSIASFLSGHPDIFISNPKEPHYFEEEIPRGVKSLKSYESLFARAKDHHKIVGEASTGYLYSKSAVDRILSYSPNARFLVSIRNPYEMAISLHAHSFLGRNENIKDFSTAWKLQASRRSGLEVPRLCISNLLLLYEDRCALGDQIERLLKNISRHHVCMIFFEDLKNKPHILYNEIYHFLNIPNDGRTNFPVLNKKLYVRLPLLANILRLSINIKKSLGIYRSLGAAKRILNAASTSKVDNPVIRDEVWQDMDHKFIPQIKKIEKLSGRNLSHWYHYRS
jgi:hypothetical protein